MKRFVNKVEIYLGAVLGWVDITTDVRGPIRITRGRTTDGGRADRGRCTLRLANETGNYSPRNPSGAWYGLIGRNTPLRVSGGRRDGALVGRFYGEVSEWPLRSTLRGNIRHVDVQAVGILQRLGQGDPPKLSPLRRAIAATDPVAYYPGEDGELSTSAASAVAGFGPLIVSGTVEFKPVDDYQYNTNVTRFGTSALPDLAAGGSLSASIPGAAAATATQWTVHAATAHDIAQIAGDLVVMEWTTPGGTFSRWQLVVVKANSHTQVIAYTPAGAATVVIDRNGTTVGFAAAVVSAQQNGANIDVTYHPSTGSTYTGSVAGTLAGVASIAVNPTGTTSAIAMPSGHLAVWSANGIPYQDGAFFDSYGVVVNDARRSWKGEAAVDRLARVCAEEDVPLAVTAPPAALVSRMGWQPIGPFLDLVDQSVDVDGGYLYEQRVALGLAYRTRASLYNQAPIPIVYTGQLTDPFEPVDDANDVRNDVTVKRDGGSSARAVQTTGPNSVLPPPAGVGRVATEVTLNLSDDGQLADHAWWRVHLGTEDRPRYPALSVQLASPEWQSAPAALDALLAVDTGDVLEVTGLPSWAAGDVRTMVLGYSEEITEETWEITYAGVPAQPWDVAEVDGAARYAGDGCTLTAAITAGAGTFQITSPAANGPWTTKAEAFPLDVRVGGERIRLSGIAGATSPQTATVAPGGRAINGVSAAWPAGTEADVWRPAVVAL